MRVTRAGSGFSMRRPARGVAAVLAMALAGAGCGGSGSSKPPCGPDSLGSLAGGVAAESALIARGRADADFGHVFGPDSQKLLDAADASRAALIQKVAADQGVVLPTPGTPTTSCSDGTATVKRGAVFTLTATAFILAAGVLNLAVTGVPVSGMTPSSPQITTESGTAADGSPTQTVTMVDTTFGGHDSTAVAMVTMSTSIMAGGKWTTEAVTVSASINVCPDSGGTAPGTFDLTVDGAAGSGSTAGSTYHGQVHDAFYFVVNDAAQVASQVDTSMVTYHATGARDAAASVTSTVNLVPGSPAQATPPVVDEDDGSAETGQIVRQCLFTFGTYTAGLVQANATSKWRGGTCVEVHVNPGSEMVDKNAQVMITAQPYHKFDKANVNSPVVATFSGVQSLSPLNQPVQAPAMFTLVAGSKFKDQGVVNLKSTSKRGIGTASATYTVRCDDQMMCPAGKKLNLETCMCECEMMQTCPTGQVWDDQTCMCVCAPRPCTGGQTWDSRSCQCVCNLQCPPGKTLNPDLCECETSCQIDPMTHVAPPTCTWVGTAHVTASEGGQLDKMPGGGAGDTVMWSMGYDASLSVTELDASKPLNLSGGVTGQYNEVEVISDGIKCTFTLTKELGVSTSVDQGTMQVFPLGDGTFMLYIDVGRDALFMGTFTDVASSPDCGDNSTEMIGLDFGSYYGMGPASGSTFTGTNSDAGGSGVNLPNGDYVKYHLSWSLRLVQR